LAHRLDELLLREEVFGSDVVEKTAILFQQTDDSLVVGQLA
jgi:hypothetical protein